MPASTDYALAPRDPVTGPRPWDCVNCTWAVIKGKMTLKFIHQGCPVHAGLPRAVPGAQRPLL